MGTWLQRVLVLPLQALPLQALPLHTLPLQAPQALLPVLRTGQCNLGIRPIRDRVHERH